MLEFRILGPLEVVDDGRPVALALWRGAPLADLAYESCAQGRMGRLAEIRLSALELRIDADLALGRHAALVPELESLVWDHPLRERLCGQLMLALYRSGRQPDALDVYRRTRTALVEGFGIEPGPALQELQRAILAHDPSLAAAVSTGAEPDRTLLLLPSETDALPALAAVAEPLAGDAPRELLVARLLGDDVDLQREARRLASWRATSPLQSRTAAFTSADASRDAVRLATEYDVELVLVDAPKGIDGPAVPPAPPALLQHSPAHLPLSAPGPPG